MFDKLITKQPFLLYNWFVHDAVVSLRPNTSVKHIKLYSQRPSDFSDVQSLWDCVYGYS